MQMVYSILYCVTSNYLLNVFTLRFSFVRTKTKRFNDFTPMCRYVHVLIFFLINKNDAEKEEEEVDDEK